MIINITIIAMIIKIMRLKLAMKINRKIIKLVPNMLTIIEKILDYISKMPDIFWSECMGCEEGVWQMISSIFSIFSICSRRCRKHSCKRCWKLAVEVVEMMELLMWLEMKECRQVSSTNEWTYGWLNEVFLTRYQNRNISSFTFKKSHVFALNWMAKSTYRRDIIRNDAK